MKAYKLEVFIIDHDDLGPDAVVEELENGHFGNDCISPRVKKIEIKDIGEWTDDHPLNKHATCDEEYRRLFGQDESFQDAPGPMCGRCYAEDVKLFPAPCKEKPEERMGEPLGMYHCPDCGAMLMAGMPHPELCDQCRDRTHPDFDGPSKAAEPKPEPGLGAMW